MRQENITITVADLLDREQIRHVFARYSRGMDRQDADILASVYWPDGCDMREQGSGIIINIGSISADQGYHCTSVYEASKAAVVSLSEGLNAELAEFGIIVKAILPGSMDTQNFNKMDLSETPRRPTRPPSRPSTPWTCSRPAPIRA
jgi:short chain dehydrogenase/SnoaL-like domain